MSSSGTTRTTRALIASFFVGHERLQELMDVLFRDMKDYKSRVESYSREMLRKDSQIKDLQGRIDGGDGCKYNKYI